MRYGVSAFLATCGIALIAVSAINPATFTPGISLLLLGILGFIANRLVYELTETRFDDADTVGRAVSIARMVLMIAAAIIVFFLLRPLLPL